MQSETYLAVDCGASSGKAAVGIFNGKKIGLKIIYTFENKPVVVLGTLYWDILRLYFEIKKSVIATRKKHGHISSMSIDAWALDFGLIDSNNKLISNLIHYREKNSAFKGIDDFFTKISKNDFFALTGYNFSQANPLFYLNQLRLERSPQLEIANKFLMVPDLLTYFLTGDMVSEFTIFSNTRMLNHQTRQIEERLIPLSGIQKDLFPNVVMSGTEIGKTTNSVSKETGISPTPVVASVSHDTASAVAGMPVSDQDKSWAFIILGTWVILGTETLKPIMDIGILKHGLTNTGGVLGRSFLAKNLTGLWIIQQCREKWIKDRGSNISWSEIDRCIFSAKPFQSYIDVENPIFSQKQIDMSQTIVDNVMHGKKTCPKDKGSISRCVYESLIFKIRYYIELVEKFTDKKIELIYLAGGGSKSELICQWLSNAMNRPTISGIYEATAMGNIMMQLKAKGRIETIEEGRSILQKSFAMCSHSPQDVKIWDDAYSYYWSSSA